VLSAILDGLHVVLDLLVDAAFVVFILCASVVLVWAVRGMLREDHQ
jgi:hypothetical protein